MRTKLFNLDVLHSKTLPRANRRVDAAAWSKLSPAEKILAHLAQGGTISPFKSLGVYRAYWLYGEILKLRKKGWQIESSKSQDITGHMFTWYSMSKLTRSTKPYVVKTYKYSGTGSKLHKRIDSIKATLDALNKEILELEKLT